MISKILIEYAELVDEELRGILNKKEPAELYEPMVYHILSGGKRVRPALCMLSCEAVAGDRNKAIPIAASLELVHAFSLVHDDIMDKDDLRRGKPTIWKKWGEALAINVGNGIYTKAYENVLKLDTDAETKLKILRKFIDIVMDVCEGQALDVSFETRDNLTIKEYVEMSTKKTASLIGGSATCGAIVGNGTQEEIDALTKYGEDVGLAFQIWDDYIDFSSKKTGKTFGSDIKKGKKTSIVCHALENADAEQKKRLIEILKTSPEKTTTEMIEEAASILDKTGSIEYAKKYTQDLIKEAKESLSVLKETEAKKTLIEFADFMVKRES